MITAIYIVYVIFTTVSVSSKSFHLDMFVLTLLADAYVSFYSFVVYSMMSCKHMENKIQILDFLKDIKRKPNNEDIKDGTRRNPPSNPTA